MRQNLILVKPLAFYYLSCGNVASKCYELEYMFVRPSYFNQSRVWSIYRKRQFSIDINSIKFNVLSPFKTMIENYLKRRVFFFFVDTFFGNTEMIQSFK